MTPPPDDKPLPAAVLLALGLNACCVPVVGPCLSPVGPCLSVLVVPPPEDTDAPDSPPVTPCLSDVPDLAPCLSPVMPPPEPGEDPSDPGTDGGGASLHPARPELDPDVLDRLPADVRARLTRRS